MKKQLQLTVIACTLIAGWLGGKVLDHANAYECEEGIVTVYHGDTLWGIANTHCGGHTGNAVYDIGKLNGVTTLQVGERITLP